MNKTLRFCCLCLLISLLPNQLIAAEYSVEIRQINPDKPDSWTYSKTCDDTKGMCNLFLGIVPQYYAYNTDDLELDVGMFFRDGGVYFQLKSGPDYFLFNDETKVRFIALENNRLEKEKIEIYAHSSSGEKDPDGALFKYPVVREPSGKVAEVEVSITPQE